MTVKAFGVGDFNSYLLNARKQIKSDLFQHIVRLDVIFLFANAGVDIDNLAFQDCLHPKESHSAGRLRLTLTDHKDFIICSQSNSDIPRKTLAPKLRQYFLTGNSVP